MIKNWKAAFGSLLLSVSMFGAGAAFTVKAQAQTAPAWSAERGGWGSDRNLATVDRRLGTLIDQLQQDQHDYGGHRVAAIGDMQRAREELRSAMRDDRGH